MAILARVSILAVLVRLSGCGNDLSRGSAEKAIEEKLNEAKEFPTVSPRFRLPVAHENGATRDRWVPTTPRSGRPLDGLGSRTRSWLHRRERADVFLPGPWQTVHGHTVRDAAYGQGEGICGGRKGLLPRHRLQVGGECGSHGHRRNQARGNGRPDHLRGRIHTTTYKLNPLSQALAGSKEVENERTGRAVFRLFDDGWRLEGS